MSLRVFANSMSVIASVLSAHNSDLSVKAAYKISSTLRIAPSTFMSEFIDRLAPYRNKVLTKSLTDEDLSSLLGSTDYLTLYEDLKTNPSYIEVIYAELSRILI